MESDMDTNMLLGGQLVNRADHSGSGADPGLPQEPDDDWARDCDHRDPARLAARLLVCFVALGLFLAALGRVSSAADGSATAQASFTPFNAAMWSESIGR
jgi:hypothetical protein